MAKAPPKPLVITLDDLTKDELLALVKRHPSICSRDALLQARVDVLYERWDAASAAALQAGRDMVPLAAEYDDARAAMAKAPTSKQAAKTYNRAYDRYRAASIESRRLQDNADRLYAAFRRVGRERGA